MPRRWFVALALMCISAKGAFGGESYTFTADGRDSFRPSHQLAAGVVGIDLSCWTHGVDNDPITQDGPVQSEINRHVARETRRLFPNLQYRNVTLGNQGKDVPTKRLHLFMKITGSGFQSDTCGAHIQATLSISDPNRDERFQCAPISVTLAESRDGIVEDLKKQLTNVLETISDGWYEPIEFDGNFHKQ